MSETPKTINELPTAAAVSGDDYIVVVVDPTGVNATKKVAVDTSKTYMTDGYISTAALASAVALLATRTAPAFTGGASFNTDTLFIDATENKVGIGTTTPDQELTVDGNLKADELITSGHMKLRSPTNDCFIYLNSTGDGTVESSEEALQIVRDMGGTETRFLSNGGTGGSFKFLDSVDLDDGFLIDGTAVTSTATQINYTSDVTSAIQAQLDAKAPLADPDFTGTVDCANLTATDKIIAEKFEAEGHLKLYSGGTNDMIVYLNSTEGIQATLNGTQVRWTAHGGTGDFRYISPVTMDKATAMADTTDPTAVAGFSHIYSKGGEAYVQDQSGNVTQISPHNSQGEWQYFSHNTKTNKTVRVNMEAMIRDLEALTGKTYIEDS